jgi:predicted transcriptional regulator
MSDKQPSRPVHRRHLVAKIVESYVRHNKLASGDIPTLIAAVRRSLNELGRPAAPTEPRMPAVPVRRSVRRDYLVCLECGYRGQMLRRHLARAHNLAPEEYRARWDLPRSYPVTAPAYSERRSAMAKSIGLGRRAASTTASAPEGAPEPEAVPVPKRRARRRTAPTP